LQDQQQQQQQQQQEVEQRRLIVYVSWNEKIHHLNGENAAAANDRFQAPLRKFYRCFAKLSVINRSRLIVLFFLLFSSSSCFLSVLPIQ